MDYERPIQATTADEFCRPFVFNLFSTTSIFLEGAVHNIFVIDFGTERIPKGEGKMDPHTNVCTHARIQACMRACMRGFGLIVAFSTPNQN